MRTASLVGLVALLAACALAACSRSPIGARRNGEDAADATGSAQDDSRSGADATDAPDSDPPPGPDPCGIDRLLDGAPVSMDGWERLPGTAYPFERIGSTFVSFAGRVFRKERTCVLVAVARPERRDDLLAELAQADGMDASGRRDHGRLSRTAPEANQVTLWLSLPNGHLAMLRAFGTTDSAVLDPFSEGMSLDAYGPDADAGTDERSACPPAVPLADPLDPRALYGPPTACMMP